METFNYKRSDTHSDFTNRHFRARHIFYDWNIKYFIVDNITICRQAGVFQRVCDVCDAGIDFLCIDFERTLQIRRTDAKREPRGEFRGSAPTPGFRIIYILFVGVNQM